MSENPFICPTRVAIVQMCDIVTNFYIVALASRNIKYLIYKSKFVVTKR